MKRTGFKKKPGKSLARRTRLKPRNKERSAAKYERNFDGPGDLHHGAYIRRQDCCLCRSRGTRQLTTTQAAHALARGMGGCNGSYRHLVALCDRHHREQERIGNHGVLELYGVDLMAEAERQIVAHETMMANGPEDLGGEIPF